MARLLLAVIYPAFISLGLPVSLLGSAWPTIYQQMVFAYIGVIVMPSMFGLIAERISPRAYPLYIFAVTIAMIAAHHRLIDITEKKS